MFNFFLLIKKIFNDFADPLEFVTIKSAKL